MTSRPEHALIVDCVRATVVAHRSAVDWPRAPSLDWAYLTAQADRHGVVPLVAREIEAAKPHDIPDAAFDEVQRRRRFIAAHNLSLAVILRELVTLLESHSVPVVPFKGPALAVEAFGDEASRQFDDLDVFVRREDLQRASSLLHGFGYRAMNLRLASAMLPGEKHVLFEHRASGTGIDVHWAIAPRRFGLALDTRRIWDSGHRVTLARSTMRAVPRDILLLMLCVHGARHRWRRLAWIADVAAVVHRSPEFPWLRLCREASRAHALRLVYLGLTLANRLLGTPLPEEIRRAIDADRICGLLAGRILKDLFEWPPRSSEVFSRAVFEWRSRERWADRCRCLLGHVWEPNVSDFDAITLPADLSWLYYGIRPFRFAARQLRRRSPAS